MKIPVLFCIILLGSICGAAQKTGTPSDETPGRGKPLLASMTVPTSWSAWPFGDNDYVTNGAKPSRLGGIEVQEREHAFLPPVTVAAELCSDLDDTEQTSLLIYDPAFVYEIEYFNTYDVKGRIFALKITYNTFLAADGSEVGAKLQGTYVDEEGRGEFRITCDKKYLHETPFPKWARKLAENKKKN